MSGDEFFYSVRERDPNRRIRCKTDHALTTFDEMAVAAATHFFYRRDGLDASWPLTFDIYLTRNKPLCATFKIYCEGCWFVVRPD